MCMQIAVGGCGREADQFSTRAHADQAAVEFSYQEESGRDPLLSTQCIEYPGNIDG